jgi:protein-L-isoaspartate(D-aspartate) O-methyltransferase
MASLAAARERCVADQIARRGVRDPRVLAAMRAVPRECFVPKEARAHAYDDCPLAIGAGQTISQPYIVAYMIAALQLEGGEKALEIGAGSGYAAAVLGRIAGEVYAVERIAELATQAVANLALAGVNNVRVRHADGTQGWPEAAPFRRCFINWLPAAGWSCRSAATRARKSLSASRAGPAGRCSARS